MVIIGIREESKRKTKTIIIEEAKHVLFEKGYIKISTKDISSRSKVSQGTIFLHFQSKENLLNYILTQLISDFNDEVKLSCDVHAKREVFLQSLLSVISIYEHVLSVVYKDYSYLSEEIKKSIDHTDSQLKSIFFDNLRNTIGKEINIVDSFVLIDAYLSQIKNYLLGKDLSSHANIIRQSSGKLNKLYRYLFL